MEMVGKGDLAHAGASPVEVEDGTPGPAIPDDWCRLCWRDTFVWRDGNWWADHIGPLAECRHGCHDDPTFLESTS
ncbi:MAG: hypothetical protein OJJ54_03675 [Pseudonocardia sp.]|nr:hypothetical protein [Pseudonocardia sp.]